jgi:acyl-CoA synthetase (AMP-forming)/AMP-acid ligase II
MSTPLGLDMNLTEALDAAIASNSGSIALVCGDERDSLRQIRAGAETLAGALEARSVRPGDRVAVLAPNGAIFVQALFGICRLGAVAVLLDVRSTPGELSEMVSAAGVGAVVVDDAPRAAVAAELVGLDRTLVAGEADDGAPGDARPRSGDLAVVFATSGTSGRPKLVGHTHRTVMASTLALHRLHAGFFGGTAGERARRVTTVLRRHGRRALRARGRQVWMTPIAFSSVSGLQVMLGGLLRGHRLVTMRSFHPRVALELVQRESVNILAATPSMAELMLAVRTAESFDPSSMLIVGLGGGPVSPELAQRVRQRFRCGVGIGYGSTELGGGVLVSRLEDPVEVQTGTVGRPFPGAQVEVVSEDGRPVAPGDVGELRCKSPSAMRGYLSGGGRAEQRDDDDEAWYRTGDLATMDERGNVRIIGRQTDMIVRGSHNVYPADVERVLDRLPVVQRSAVVGVPDDRSGEQVWAFVAVEEGSHVTTRDLFAHCRDRLAGYKVPDHICIRAALPLTHDGKVQRFRLVEEALAGGGRSVSRRTS